MTTLITYRGTPLEVDYEVSDHGDVDISEVWINGVEMIVLLADDVLAQIRDAVKRKEET